TWVSKPTIKVPQVSVLFNFQGPAVLSALVDSLFIIQHQVPFVKNFFEVFSDFLEVFQPRKTRTSCCYGLFSGRPSRDSLTILPQVVVLCQQVFSKFLKFPQKLHGTVDFCDERMIHQFGRLCQEKSYNFGIPHNADKAKAYNLTKVRLKLYAV
ncbi:hypothetical protein, partial [uncultured Gemmiger sp.]|uniref:hypothetical protein n=1 Tax=uncultured Gemmiger sp. TaxID=1623490 RepID=UPI0025DB1D95